MQFQANGSRNSPSVAPNIEPQTNHHQTRYIDDHSFDHHKNLHSSNAKGEFIGDQHKSSTTSVKIAATSYPRNYQTAVEQSNTREI